MSSTSDTAPIVRQAGEGEHVLQMRACVSVKLPASAAEDGRVSVAEFWMPAQFGPPLHVHHAEDELLQIMHGTVRVACGGTDLVLRPGGFAYLPRGVPHTFWVQGSEPARMLTIFTPGGVEQMFVDAGTPTEIPRLPEDGGTTPGGLDASMSRYRVEYVGPPLGS